MEDNLLYNNQFINNDIEETDSEESEEESEVEVIKKNIVEENLLIINSIDRNWDEIGNSVIDSNTFNYSVKFAPTGNLGEFIGQSLMTHFFRTYKNIVSIEITDIIMPNIYLNLDNLHFLSDSKNDIVNYNTSLTKNLKNIKIPTLYDLPYICLKINEIGSNIDGTNSDIYTSTSILVPESHKELSNNNSGYIGDSNGISYSYNNVGKNLVDNCKKSIKFKNITPWKKMYYPNPKSSINLLNISFFEPNGKQIKLMHDFLDISSIGLGLTTNSGAISSIHEKVFTAPFIYSSGSLQGFQLIWNINQNNATPSNVDSDNGSNPDITFNTSNDGTIITVNVSGGSNFLENDSVTINDTISNNGLVNSFQIHSTTPNYTTAITHSGSEYITTNNIIEGNGAVVSFNMTEIYGVAYGSILAGEAENNVAATFDNIKGANAIAYFDNAANNLSYGIANSNVVFINQSNSEIHGGDTRYITAPTMPRPGQATNSHVGIFRQEFKVWPIRAGQYRNMNDDQLSGSDLGRFEGQDGQFPGGGFNLAYARLIHRDTEETGDFVESDNIFRFGPSNAEVVFDDEDNWIRPANLPTSYNSYIPGYNDDITTVKPIVFFHDRTSSYERTSEFQTQAQGSSTGTGLTVNITTKIAFNGDNMTDRSTDEHPYDYVTDIKVKNRGSGYQVGDILTITSNTSDLNTSQEIWKDFKITITEVTSNINIGTQIIESTLNSGILSEVGLPSPNSSLFELDQLYSVSGGSPDAIIKVTSIQKSSSISPITFFVKEVTGKSISLNTSKYFSPEEYNIGDKIFIKNVEFDQTDNYQINYLDKTNLQDYINRSDGHIIIGLADSSNTKSTCKLYNQILISLPFTIDYTNGQSTIQNLYNLKFNKAGKIRDIVPNSADNNYNFVYITNTKSNLYISNNDTQREQNTNYFQNKEITFTLNNPNFSTQGGESTVTHTSNIIGSFTNNNLIQCNLATPLTIRPALNDRYTINMSNSCGSGRLINENLQNIISLKINIEKKDEEIFKSRIIS